MGYAALNLSYSLNARAEWHLHNVRKVRFDNRVQLIIPTAVKSLVQTIAATGKVRPLQVGPLIGAKLVP